MPTAQDTLGITGAPMMTFGVDVGGSKVEVTLVDNGGRVIQSHRHPTEVDRGASQVISDIVDCVHGCFPDLAPQAGALGIAVAGQVDAAGTVLLAPKLRWTDLPLGHARP